VTGWASSQYISVKDSAIGTAVVTGSVVNVRESSSTSSSIVAKVEKGDRVSVYSRRSVWYKVKTSSGIVGWISGDYISMASASRGAADQIGSAESNASDSDTDTAGNKLVQYAKKFVGTAYVYGGSSPSGFDCSGFTQYVYKHFGYSLNRVASSQAGQGKSVSKANLQPGDLVFFTFRSKYINHVGMYIGGGKFIHAASSRIGRVVIENLSGCYSTYYAGARRIIN
jgi:cell wall-associated NlpC family hydrolase